MIKKMAVYCGARSGNRPEYAKAAYEFGKKNGRPPDRASLWRRQVWFNASRC